MRKLTEAKFTEAVYRNYHGETISSIANDFGIGISTLSERRDRHREQWDRIRDKIIDADIAHDDQMNTIPIHSTLQGRFVCQIRLSMVEYIR